MHEDQGGAKQPWTEELGAQDFFRDKMQSMASLSVCTHSPVLGITKYKDSDTQQTEEYRVEEVFWKK